MIAAKNTQALHDKHHLEKNPLVPYPFTNNLLLCSQFGLDSSFGNALDLADKLSSPHRVTNQPQPTFTPVFLEWSDCSIQ
jgi:hypothetical protein